MKLKQSRHLLTSWEPLLGRILNHVTLLNLIRILHNKGGKLYSTSLHFCYVEACRKSHNVGVQHLLIGFHVVTMFLKATLGRMLKSVCRACDWLFKVKNFPLITFDLIYYYHDDVTLILETFPCLDALFRPSISKFLLHVLHSRLCFWLTLSTNLI